MDSHQQRMDEWEKIDNETLKYHSMQWDTPKKSTLAFEKFASKHIKISRNVIDMGAGAGAATAYIAKKHINTRFTAFDCSAELIAIGSRFSDERKLKNITFKKGDWLNMEPTSEFDGVISLQTLSWLPDYESPLLEIFEKINPRWICLTSLFYEGDITCQIEVHEHKRDKKCFYNVYSLPAIGRFCQINGYSLKKSAPFNIDIDIERPTNNDIMGTYTQRVIANHSDKIQRIQISGPLLMNWHMVLIERM